jgi:hypothetical protein
MSTPQNTQDAALTPLLTPAEVEAAVAAKSTRFASVLCLKKDGTPRKMRGLFRPTSKILGTGRGTAPHLVAIWIPEQGWRSFDKSRVVAIR